ncbi:MAG: helix-turn-helix domain-containing protein, partial [Gaiellaceae bacterium]
MSASEWLTLGVAAAYLGVAKGTLRRWADQGRVPAFYTPGAIAASAGPISTRSSSASARPAGRGAAPRCSSSRRTPPRAPSCAAPSRPRATGSGRPPIRPRAWRC